MTMIRSLLRFSKRQLHTLIISKEIIKPSSPTPSNLKTYNLSLIDQIIPATFIPMVTFFPNTTINRNPHEKTLELKNSLSQTLTKYYPFAGKHAKFAPASVDCNDNGAEFLEAKTDITLFDFLQNSNHQDLEQFFPHGLVNYNSNREKQDLDSDKVSPLEVQINHFKCGGVAVAVSLSHKLADGCSLVHFINDWAKMTKFCSGEQNHELPADPIFLPFQYKNTNFIGLSLQRSKDCVTKSFVFPKSKINDLKLKIKSMTAESEHPITNPTRVEVLNWLLYNCAVAAATKNNSGFFKPTGVDHLTNMRWKLMESLPEKSIGNFSMAMQIRTNNESKMKPEVFISELKKLKMQFRGLRNIKTVFGLFSGIAIEEGQMKLDESYICSSFCGYPTYEVDFGWGKPVKTTFAGDVRKNSFLLMDAPNGDGIEALVCLGKEDMDIFQSDHQLLAFC